MKFQSFLMGRTHSYLVVVASQNRIRLSVDRHLN